MKKLLFAFVCATAAHGFYWGKRYLQTPATERSLLILLGPLAGMFETEGNCSGESGSR